MLYIVEFTNGPKPSLALDSVDVSILQLEDIFYEMVKICSHDNKLSKKYTWHQKRL